MSGIEPRFEPPHPDWGLVRPASSPFPETARAGEGTLRLRVGHSRLELESQIVPKARQADRRRTGERIATLGDLTTSLVPVVVVDGEAAATGWGEVTLALPEGRHLVEVQSLHSRAWRLVDVEAGAVTEIDYVGVLGEAHLRCRPDDRTSAYRQYDGHAIGPKNRFAFKQLRAEFWKDRRGNAAFLVAYLALGLVLGLIRWGTGEVTLVQGALTVGAGVLIALVLAAKVALEHRRSRGSGPAAPGIWVPRADPTALPAVVVDPAGEVPHPGPGAAAVLIEAEFDKEPLEAADIAAQLPPGVLGLTAPYDGLLAAFGEVRPRPDRPAVPPPGIELDGRPLASAWARLWIEVPPGTHRLVFTAPAAPVPVSGRSEATEPVAVEFDVEAGTTAEVSFAVAVTAVPEPNGPGLRTWRATAGPPMVSGVA